MSLGKTLILAHILSPAQFGVYGIAALTLSLLEVFTETGVNTVLIQLKQKADDYIDSAWVVSIIRGALICIIMLLGANAVSTFFSIPESLNLIVLASAIPLIRGFINPSIVNFQKDLLFQKEFAYRTLVFGVDAVVSVSLALITRNPESLIWGLLIGAGFEVILSHIIVSPRPRFVFQKENLKLIIHRGKWMTATGILDYLVQNGDNMVVGKLLGSSSLGLYQMSYQVSTLPVTEISNILSKVTFPIFMKMSSDKARLRSAYYRVVLFIAGVVGFITVLILLFSNVFLFILGPQWTDIIPTIRILSIFAFFKSVILSSYAFFLAKGLQEHVSVISLTGFISMFIVILPLVNTFGVNGAAYAALFGSLVSIFPMIYYLRRT